MTTSEETYEGIPRKEIPWDLKIDYEICITCEKCIDFYHVGAFKLVEENNQKRTVVNPDKCIVFCRGCGDICLVGAIIHPSEDETKKTIYRLKKKFKLEQVNL